MFAKIAKSKWSWLITFILCAVIIYVLVTVKSLISTLNYVLTPPKLPLYEAIPIKYDVNIPEAENSAEWFHHVSQGTATMPIPYRWLMALEEPKRSPWLIFAFAKKPFIEEYMLRLGFIKSQGDNPLPIGLAKTGSMYFEGINRRAEAVGFTCAACHTGQLTYLDSSNQRTRYVVNGGPAMVDLGLLTQSLGAALGQTALSSKLPILGGRFDRFAHRVLGSTYSVVSKAALKNELSATLAVLSKTQDTINVTEGFSRLDALNRIGNQVFSRNISRPSNYAAIDAPVNYPHIWNTPWFDWVQYDGSIMQPLIRNSGESMGVSASVHMPIRTQSTDFIEQSTRYSSSVPVRSLHQIEQWIAGEYPFSPSHAQPKFTGLAAPIWPANFPPIAPEQRGHGEQLYRELCQSCHLPAVSSEAFWGDQHWYKINYEKFGRVQSTDKKYLKLKIIPLHVINTDPAQAKVLQTRTVDTSGLEMQTHVCTVASPALGSVDKNESAKLSFVELQGSATANYALALGAAVQLTNEQWFAQNATTAQWRDAYKGGRPNCLQSGMGYKARPLNGIWATAPFLHNGSIANLDQLLSPQAERARFVELGSTEFDPTRVGIVQGAFIKKFNARYQNSAVEKVKDYYNGRFILDTQEPGNLNTGHLFDDHGQTIGRKLNESEKTALIAYLKTL